MPGTSGRGPTYRPHRHTLPGRPSSPRHRPASGAPGRCAAVLTNSWFPLLQHESNSPDRVDEFFERLRIHFPAEACDMHVNDIVERRTSRRLLPDIPGEHIPHDDLPFVAHQILEQFELTRRQVDEPAAAGDLSTDNVHV